MIFERSSGVVLHPTSLPGPQGIGTLGAAAYRFIDFLADAGQRLWQMCPLGPTGFGNSPYQCFSAFAGNPLLIDVERLIELGWLERDEVQLAPAVDLCRVDYPEVIARVWPLLDCARQRFETCATSEQRAAFAEFCREQALWLDEYALFMAIKATFDQRAWQEWDAPLRLREPAALEQARQQLADGIMLHRFTQYLFYEQWAALKRYAHGRGVKVIGDIPIFGAYDSADVWAHRELFLLDQRGLPTVVAGVPPDYFSATGQLWGNPIYDWDVHQRQGFSWWVDVVRAKLAFYDFFRVDHFRGFCAYWAVPYGETTAINGSWQPTPGKQLFEALEQALGRLPIIAEDLGVITRDVEELRDHFGFPGMKILQFAFDSAEDHEFRPHTYPFHCVVYTGTHDNDTVLGWHAKAKPHDRAYAEEYLAHSGDSIVQTFLRSAWASTATMALAPLQDLLELGSEARMNTPGTLGGNWEWRFTDDALTPELAQRLRRLSEVYVRAGDAMREKQST